MADIDDDGDLDVVFASEQQNKIGWFENVGRGSSFTEHVIATDMLHAKSVWAEDIDWDGDLDILATASRKWGRRAVREPPRHAGHLLPHM